MRNFAKCSIVSMVTKHAFLDDFSTKERATHAHTWTAHKLNRGCDGHTTHPRDLVSAPAHALPRASSGLTGRARRPAHPTASWLLQPPATLRPLAPWPLREANIGRLVRVYQLEVQLGLLRRERLNGVEAGLPLAEAS